MNIEDLSIKFVARCANADDIDVSQFGHRLLKFLNLAVRGVKPHEDIKWMRNAHEVLTKNLNNPAFMAHVYSCIGQPIEVVQPGPSIEDFDAFVK